MNAPRTVVLLVGGAVAVTFGGQLAEGKTPRIRLLIAGAGAAIVLSLIAGAIPTAATLFAVLVFLGSLFGPGYPLLTALTKLIT